MRNRKDKIFALIAAGCLCLSGLTGCGEIKMSPDNISSKSDGKKFYQREVYISDAINMAKESRYVLTGLVINAFTDSVILNWDQLGTVITDADDGEEKTMYKR